MSRPSTMSSSRSPTSPISLQYPSENTKEHLLSHDTAHEDSLKTNAEPEKEVDDAPIVADRNVMLPQPRSLVMTTLATIVGGYTLAILLAIGHHVYLTVMDGQGVKNIPKSTFGSQLWIKTASVAFSRAVVLALGLAAGGVLTQMAWRAAAKRAMPLEKLDHIFQLPSSLSLPSLMFSSLFTLLLPIFILVIGIQALELVSSIAPNALQIATGPGGIRHIPVPSLNLSQGIVTSSDGWDANDVQPSAEWSRIVQRVMLTVSGIALGPPPNCSLGCEYTIKYSAPAMQCHTLPDSELTLPLFNETNDLSNVLYNGTSTLNDTSIPYGVRLQWQSVDINGGLGPTLPGFGVSNRSGVECQFCDATYSTKMFFKGTSRSVHPSILKWNAPLVGPLANQPTSNCSTNILNFDLVPPCWVTGMNYRATVAAFAKVISGTIIYDSLETKMRSSEGMPELLPLFNIAAVRRALFSEWTFEPAVSNVSESLEQMFMNVTLGLIWARNDTADVDVTFECGPAEWSYDPSILWATYGAALAIVTVFVVYGLWCIWEGGVVDSTFSDFILATRGMEIDRAVAEAEDRDAFTKTVMQYEMYGHFKVMEKQIGA